MWTPLLSEVAEDERGDLHDLLEAAALDAWVERVQIAPDSAHLLEVPDLEALLEEAKKWDPKLHPRWPPGTPRAGEFMKVGQRFEFKGKDYEVAHSLDGGIYAHVASGSVHDAATVHIPATADGKGGLHIEGVKAAKAKPLIGGKSKSNVTVVDPYVDASTHDPSVPKPEGITAEQWTRFGKLDQQHFLELQDRFGKWAPGKAQTLHNQAYAEFDSSISSLVKQAFNSQYGSSSGHSLSLTSIFQGLSGAAGAALQAAHTKRERAKELQGELASVVQWDLYNRTGSPDLATFHKQSTGVAYWQPYLSGQKPIFSGLSQSFQYRASFFGSTALATPVAIRHILMSTYSAKPSSSADSFYSELEVSVPEQMKLDKRSVAFERPGHGAGAITESQKKWLEGVTKAPKGGDVLDLFRAALKGNADLPIPPAPPNIVAIGAGGKQWKDPPGGAATQTSGWKFPEIKGNAYTPTDPALKGLDFEHYDEAGNPEPRVAVDMGLKPGDYMMGLKGTVYWIGADPGDSSGFGLRYHKIVNGAFTGESYNFEGGGKNKYFKLKGFFAEPKPPSVEGFKAYDPNAYTIGKDEHFVGKLKKGNKLKVAGAGYELAEDGTMGNVLLTSLETGKQATINGDYKTAVLIPKEGYVEPSQADVTPGSWVMTPHGKTAVVLGSEGSDVLIGWTESDGTKQKHLYAASELQAADGPPKLVAQSGDVFAHEGKKYTVTSIMKNGTVRAKPQGGNVEKFNPDHPSLDNIYRTSDWIHSPGEKAKLKSLAAGDLFDGGTGQKPRPYKLLAFEGKKAKVLNLETGKESTISWNKAHRRLIPAPFEGEQVTPGTPKNTPVGLGAEVFDVSRYEVGAPTPVAEMKKGDLVLSPKGTPYMLEKQPDPNIKHVVSTNLITGKPYPIEYGKAMRPLQHKEDVLAATSAYDTGDLVQLGWLDVGEQFKVGESNYEVVKPSDGPEDNAVVGVVQSDGSVGQTTSEGAFPGFVVSYVAKPLPSEQPAEPAGGGEHAHGLQVGDDMVTADGEKATVQVVYADGSVSFLHSDGSASVMDAGKVENALTTGALTVHATTTQEPSKVPSYVVPGEHLVLKPPNGTTSDHVKVSKIEHPDGHAFVKYTDGPLKGESVWVPADWLHEQTGGPVPEALKTPDQHPHASTAGFVPYKSATSGKEGVGAGVTKNPKLSTLTEGTHFTDKTGKEWVLKDVQGPMVTVSDGVKNYKIEATARVKVADKVGLHDTAPLAPVPASMPATEANPHLLPMEAYDLKPGDYVLTGSGGAYVSGPPNDDGWIPVQDVATGKKKPLSPLYAPVMVQAGKAKFESYDDYAFHKATEAGDNEPDGGPFTPDPVAPPDHDPSAPLGDPEWDTQHDFPSPVAPDEPPPVELKANVSKTPLSKLPAGTTVMTNKGDEYVMSGDTKGAKGWIVTHDVNGKEKLLHPDYFPHSYALPVKEGREVLS